MTLCNIEGASFNKVNIISGDASEGDTPVSIPNTAVKPFSADGTKAETLWESRTLPELHNIKEGSSAF